MNFTGGAPYNTSEGSQAVLSQTHLWDACVTLFIQAAEKGTPVFRYRKLFLPIFGANTSILY